MSENHRGPEVPEVRAPAVERLDGLARITLEELATTHFVKNGTLQNACSTSPRVVAEKCSYAPRQVDEQPSKKSQKNGDKSAVTMLKSTRQSGCVFQEYGAVYSLEELRQLS